MVTVNKCMHLKRLQDSKPYICLLVAGTKFLVVLCSDCYSKLLNGEEIKVTFNGRKVKSRKVKLYNYKNLPLFPELFLSMGENFE